MAARVLETECQQPYSDQAFYGQHNTPHDTYPCAQLDVATAQRVADLAAAALARVAEALISKHGEVNDRRAVARSVADLDDYLMHSGGNCTSATLGSFDVAIDTVLRRCCAASADIAPLPASPVASAPSPSRRHRRPAAHAALQIDTVFGGQQPPPRRQQQQQRRVPAASCPSSPTGSPKMHRRTRSNSVCNLEPIAAEATSLRPRSSGSTFNILQMLAAPFQRASRPSSPDFGRRSSQHQHQADPDVVERLHGLVERELLGPSRRVLSDLVRACDAQDTLCCPQVLATAEQLADHTARTCPFAPEHCSLCGATVCRRDLEAHMQACEQCAVACTACGAPVVGQSRLEDHLATDCPKRLVRCTFGDVGCTDVVPCDQLRGHLSNAVTKHLLLIHQASGGVGVGGGAGAGGSSSAPGSLGTSMLAASSSGRQSLVRATSASAPPSAAAAARTMTPGPATTFGSSFPPGSSAVRSLRRNTSAVWSGTEQHQQQHQHHHYRDSLLAVSRKPSAAADAAAAVFAPPTSPSRPTAAVAALPQRFVPSSMLFSSGSPSSSVATGTAVPATPPSATASKSMQLWSEAARLVSPVPQRVRSGDLCASSLSNPCSVAASPTTKKQLAFFAGDDLQAQQCPLASSSDAAQPTELCPESPSSKPLASVSAEAKPEDDGPVFLPAAGCSRMTAAIAAGGWKNKHTKRNNVNQELHQDAESGATSGDELDQDSAEEAEPYYPQQPAVYHRHQPQQTVVISTSVPREQQEEEAEAVVVAAQQQPHKVAAQRRLPSATAMPFVPQPWRVSSLASFGCSLDSMGGTDYTPPGSPVVPPT